jgi:iron complex outermembrane receptor protein
MDIGGPLNDSKTLTYRFNGVYENAESYRQGVKTERVFLAPTFGWEASPRDTFRLELEYLYDRSPIDRGIVAVGDGPANIPVSRFLGDPTKQDTINQGKATLQYLHDFNSMWRWRTGLRVAVAAEDYNSLESWVMDDESGILSLAQFHIPTLVQSNYMQNEVHGKFSTGSIRHKLLAGVEIGWEFSKQNVMSDSADFDNLNAINIYDPVYAFRSNQLVSQFNGTTKNQIVGVYAGDQIDLLDNLHMHVGGRYDYFYQVQSQDPSLFSPTGGTDKQTDNHFSPSVGMTYQPIKPVAMYVNYTQSFAPQPTISRSASGQLFKPETGEQIEGGFKFQFFEGKLRSTLAAFDIKKKNVLTADISQGPGSGFSQATGEQQSTGFEFDVAGQVFPGFEIIANYAYIKARVSQDNTFVVGSRLPDVPLNQGSVWATYFFQEGVVKGFGAGLGMFAQSQRNGLFQCQDPANCQAPFSLPGFVRMDAALYYRKPEVFNKTNLLAAINFTNLLDQRYFSGAQQFREIVYTGAPLTVLGSLKLEFN